jgi:hypothetical protein
MGAVFKHKETGSLVHIRRGMEEMETLIHLPKFATEVLVNDPA